MKEELDIKLMEAAMRGDKEAARMYCGSYSLVERGDGEYFRCKGDTPEGYLTIVEFNMKSVYDKDGFLLEEYWALPRLGK